MSELDNLPKVEIKADLAKVTEEVYTDAFKNPLNSTSKITTTVLDFFHNTVMYPLQRYNLYAKDKLKKYEEDLKNKAQKIPNENLVSPRVNILGPTMEGLKYNLDEEHIKEIFTNILLSDMDNRKQDKILPAYIEIVKQLNPKDAKTLQQIKADVGQHAPILKLKYIFTNNGFTYVSDNILLLYNETKYVVLDSLVLDNLCRLKLIELDFNEYLSDETIYQNAFKLIKCSNAFKTLPHDVKELGYSQGLLKTTSFGQNFIDICLS